MPPSIATTQRTAIPVSELVLRGCALLTPYRAGFEDYEYDKKYDNPFSAGSAGWIEYDLGSQTARATNAEWAL